MTLWGGFTRYENELDSRAIVAKDELIQAKGYFIFPSELFENINKNDENLNTTLQKTFNNIESSAEGTQSQKNFKGLFSDIDLNSNNLGSDVKSRNARLVKIIDAIGNLKLTYNNNTIDAFGDAYEYLIFLYASSAKKSSGGEFFTPQEVSNLLAKITLHNNPKPNKVYDPACGSGSLLLQFKKILPEDPSVGYFGQEINLTTYNLARMNMILHDVNFTQFNIALGDTLINPQLEEDEPFHIVVSNPPYSKKWIGDSDITLINDNRYAPAGILAPKSKADFAFIMHSLSWIDNTGCGAIVVFPGILYRSGAEAKIRKYLIDNNYVDCIIALSENLFFGTGIATNIMVLKKNKKDYCTLFIDARDCFTKVTNKNKLSDENINEILKLYKNRANVAHKVALINNGQIQENNYNLSVQSYVEAKDDREQIDIKALNSKICETVARQNELRIQIDLIVRELELV